MWNEIQNILGTVPCPWLPDHRHQQSFSMMYFPEIHRPVCLSQSIWHYCNQFITISITMLVPVCTDFTIRPCAPPWSVHHSNVCHHVVLPGKRSATVRTEDLELLLAVRGGEVSVEFRHASHALATLGAVVRILAEVQQVLMSALAHHRGKRHGAEVAWIATVRCGLKHQQHPQCTCAPEYLNYI